MGGWTGGRAWCEDVGGDQGSADLFHGLVPDQGRDPNVSAHIRGAVGICIRLCAPQARPRSECDYSHPQESDLFSLSQQFKFGQYCGKYLIQEIQKSHLKTKARVDFQNAKRNHCVSRIPSTNEKLSPSILLFISFVIFFFNNLRFGL